MKKARVEKEGTISGVVTATDWDDEDNVIGVSIITDEDEYLVEQNRIGEELFDFLDEDVEVTGIVETDPDGTRHIRVAGFEVLETDYDSDYDDEDDDYVYSEDYRFDDEDDYDDDDDDDDYNAH
jgi:hypothetical protein